MRKHLLILLCVLSAGGCFFGGENDSATDSLMGDGPPAGPVDPDPDPVNPPRARFVSPGTYVGDYTWIDSNVYELESELILEAKGSYNLFWMQLNETVINQRGDWSQRDSSFFFGSIEQLFVNSDSLFQFPDPMDNDTNALRNLTDTSFLRLEWTPLRQKPYWIQYRRKTAPALAEGGYVLRKSYPDSAGEREFTFTVNLENDDYFLSVTQDTREVFQATAKWRQLGSFLALEDMRERGVDSTGAFMEWESVFGYALKRLDAVSDTGFSLWTPTSFRHPIGNWDVYRAFASTASGML